MGQGGLEGCNRSRVQSEEKIASLCLVLDNWTLRVALEPELEEGRGQAEAPTGLSLSQLCPPCVSSAPSTPGSSKKTPQHGLGKKIAPLKSPPFLEVTH